MDLTLSEVEAMIGVSRFQVSRYATDGKLKRSRHGHYEAASLARLLPPFDRYQQAGHPDEERAVWRVRAEYAFRRALLEVIVKRHRDKQQSYAPVTLTDDEEREIGKTARDYAAILAARPDREP